MKHVGTGLWFKLLLVLTFSGASAYAGNRSESLANDPVREVAAEQIRLASAEFSGAEEKSFFCEHLASTANDSEMTADQRDRVNETLRNLCR